jgi:hypothetical protein
MSELTRRYIVMAMATEGPFDLRDPDAPFVLKPWKDPAALRALEAYRDYCYPELGVELDAWIKEIASGQRIRGGVGERNERHLASRAKPSQKLPAKRRPRPKVKMKVAERKTSRKKRKRRP